MDCITVREITKSRTQLSDFHVTGSGKPLDGSKDRVWTQSNREGVEGRREPRGAQEGESLSHLC